MAKNKGTGEPVIKTYKVLTPINGGGSKRLKVGETFEADANEGEVVELLEVGAIVEA